MPRCCKLPVSLRFQQKSPRKAASRAFGSAQPTPVFNVLVNGYSGACTSVGGGVGYTGCYDAEQIYDFHDVTSGNNSNGGSRSYNAVANYDLVTGLGSPAGQNSINLLIPAHTSPTSTSVSLSYTSGRPTTFSAHVTSSSGAISNTGSVSFSYSNYSGTTQACGANVVNNNASCSTNVNDQTNQYTIPASYGGNTYQYTNGCAASSTSTSAIGSGYGFN